MNRWLMIRRLRGPAFLILLGVNALLNAWGILSFGRSWPLYLILAGIFRLAERAALADAPPPPYPPYAPAGYPAGPNPAYPGASYPSTSSLVPSQGSNQGPNQGPGQGSNQGPGQGVQGPENTEPNGGPAAPSAAGNWRS